MINARFSDASTAVASTPILERVLTGAAKTRPKVIPTREAKVASVLKMFERMLDVVDRWASGSDPRARPGFERTIKRLAQDMQDLQIGVGLNTDDRNRYQMLVKSIKEKLKLRIVHQREVVDNTFKLAAEALARPTRRILPASESEDGVARSVSSRPEGSRVCENTSLSRQLLLSVTSSDIGRTSSTPPPSKTGRIVWRRPKTR